MPVTQFTTDNIGEVRRNDLDITTSGEAVVRKIIAGTNVTLGSTGVDAGTGDVTINASVTGGSGVARSVVSISSTTTGGTTTSTDYLYLCTGTFTFTLPTAISNTNIYTIKNVGTGIITIITTSSQTVNGDTNANTLYPGNSVDLISDNSGWQQI